jgi:2,4-didehydro-3-deoxy-L-rhamnonate hydrolase
MDTSKFTLATLQTPDGPKAAIGVNNNFYPLSEAQPSLRNATVKDLLQEWSTSFSILQALAIDIARGNIPTQHGTSADVADLLTPVLYPDKLLGVGANYSGHLKEMGLPSKKWVPMPFFFRPPTTSLVGPGETVRIPKSTKQFDWECELAIVVGKRLRHASKEEAAQAIAGYSIGLDLSCRDLIKPDKDKDIPIDLVRAKAQDTMAPCGPYIVPAQFMPDVDRLQISLFVNDQQMMDASTNEMLYKCDEVLSIISEHVTLVPGDIIFTGSPAGSAGVHGNCWLKPGDKIHAQIDGIGELDVQIQRE